MPANSCSLVTVIGSIELTIAPPELPPFAVDAIVEEQDTNLLLGVDAEIREPYESYNTLVSQMITQQPRAPGEVIVKENHPMKFLAVIHNLEHKPTWKKIWIAKTLTRVFIESKNRKINTLAMPVLGTIYGSLEIENFIELFRSALATGNAAYPEKIWLIVPAPACTRIMDLLRRH